MSMQDKKLIAYCELDCSQCFGYTRTIPEAAKNLRRVMRQERMKVAWLVMPFLGDYDSFKKSLDRLASLGCKSCRENGGNPWCKIRKCCQKKGYESCAECDQFETCDKLKFLETYHKNEHIKNLRRLRDGGTKADR